MVTGEAEQEKGEHNKKGFWGRRDIQAPDVGGDAGQQQGQAANPAVGQAEQTQRQFNNLHVISSVTLFCS